MEKSEFPKRSACRRYSVFVELPGIVRPEEWPISNATGPGWSATWPGWSATWPGWSVVQPTGNADHP